MRAVQFTDSAFNMPRLASSLDQTFLTEEEAQTKFLTNTASAFTAPAALVANTATIASMAGSATQAGHSQTADSANQAGKLTNARTIKTDLGSVDAKGFDGTNDVLPGVTGTLPVAHGGTGQTTLALTRYALGLGNTIGTLEVAYGGTGITSNPSMLVNLGTTAAATVFQASPRPGVTGTLPVAYGGTGATNLANITVGSASNAGYANSAAVATTSAKYATTAGVATTSAHYATSAGTAGTCTGNAATATKWYTARTITLKGDVTGSATIDGSGNITITCAVDQPNVFQARNIPSSYTSFNDIITPGIWRVQNAATLTERPCTGTVYLFVIGRTDALTIIQMCFYYAGTVAWMRGGTDLTSTPSWTAWQKINNE